VSSNTDADLYGRDLVRAVIEVKWDSYARAFLLMQFVQFLVFMVLFLTYLAVAIYHNDPAWTTAEVGVWGLGRGVGCGGRWSLDLVCGG